MVLTWYILKQCLHSLVLSSLVLVVLVWLSQTLRLVELLVNNGALVADSLLVTLLAMPLWSFLLLPIATTIASVSTLTKLQQDKEIVAMNAAGISPFRIGLAPIVMGLMVSAFLLVNSTYLLPVAFAQYAQFIHHLKTSAPAVILREGVFVDIIKGLTIYVDEKEGAHAFKDIFIRDSRDDARVVEIHAERANIDLSTQNPSLELFNGMRVQIDEESEKAQIFEFDSYLIYMTQDTIAGITRRRDYNEMSIRELLTNSGDSPQDFRRMRAEAHYRITSPWLPLTLAILTTATFFSRRFQRSQYWTPIVAVIGLAFFTLLAHVVARSLVVVTPWMFPLLYLTAFAPMLCGLLVLAQPWKRRGRRHKRGARA